MEWPNILATYGISYAVEISSMATEVMMPFRPPNPQGHNPQLKSKNCDVWWEKKFFHNSFKLFGMSSFSKRFFDSLVLNIDA